MKPREMWQVSYEDWRDLVIHANLTALLREPENVWIEAWRQAVVYAKMEVLRKTNNQEAADALDSLLPK